MTPYGDIVRRSMAWVLHADSIELHDDSLFSLRNGFTAYAVLSPATNSFCHRRQRIETCRSPVGPTHLRWLDISNGCQDHTVLPYATSAVRLRAVNRSRDQPRPATTLRADAAASTASHPAFVTIAKRPSCRERTGRAGRADLPDGESEIFFREGTGRPKSNFFRYDNLSLRVSQTEFRRVGKGALAPCPPSLARCGWWARFALPTLRTGQDFLICPTSFGTAVMTSGHRMFSSNRDAERHQLGDERE